MFTLSATFWTKPCTQVSSLPPALGTCLHYCRANGIQHYHISSSFYVLVVSHRIFLTHALALGALATVGRVILRQTSLSTYTRFQDGGIQYRGGITRTFTHDLFSLLVLSISFPFRFPCRPFFSRTEKVPMPPSPWAKSSMLRRMTRLKYGVF